jgi:hypothetical protein
MLCSLLRVLEQALVQERQEQSRLQQDKAGMAQQLTEAKADTLQLIQKFESHKQVIVRIAALVWCYYCTGGALCNLVCPGCGELCCLGCCLGSRTHVQLFLAWALVAVRCISPQGISAW